MKQSNAEPNAGLRKRLEGIPLGRIAGIPVILAYSWFIIAAFIVLVFGPLLQRTFEGLGFWAYAIAFVYALLLLFSVLIHELAHAVVGRFFAWPTEKIVLTLWGGHTQFENFKATPGRSLLVAFSGPVANFILAGLGWILVQVLPHPTSQSAVIVTALANIFVWANFLIGVFNVLPGLPLDGGRLVESIVWKITGDQDKGTVAAGWAGRILVVVLVVAFLAVPLISHGPNYDLQTGLFTLFIAGFLWYGASSAISGAKMRLRLPAISAAKLSEPAMGIADDSSVATTLSMISAAPGTAIVLCERDGKPRYLVDPLALASVPINAAASTPATAVAKHLPEGGYVPETASGQELVQYLAQLEGTEYAVVNEKGSVVGLLRQRTVVAAITGKPLREAE